MAAAKPPGKTKSDTLLPIKRAAYREFMHIVEGYPCDLRKVAASLSTFVRRCPRDVLEYVETRVTNMDLPDKPDLPGTDYVDLAYALGVLTGIMLKEYRRRI